MVAFFVDDILHVNQMLIKNLITQKLHTIYKLLNLL